MESQELLMWMAERQSDFMSCAGSQVDPGVYPVRLIAKSLNLSVYKTRKLVKKLSDDGMLVLRKYNYSDEYDVYPLVKMWALSDKAWELEEVKEIKKRVEKDILEHFNIE